MKTTPEARITALTVAGHWGVETLQGLLTRNAAALPDALAVKDQPNRAELTGHPPQVLTWSQLRVASGNLARQLQAAGIAEGDALVVEGEGFGPARLADRPVLE